MINKKKKKINDVELKNFLASFSCYGNLVEDIYPEKEFYEYYNHAIENNLIKKENTDKNIYYLDNNIKFNLNFEWIRYFLLHEKIKNINLTCKKAFISEETLRKILSNTKKQLNSKNIDDNILFSLKNLYNSIYEAEENLKKLSNNTQEIKIGFVGNHFLLIDFINDFFSLYKDIKISIKGFFYSNDAVKAIENNEVDIGILNFIPESEKISLIKNYIDNIYIIKSKNNTNHFIGVKDFTDQNILNKYSKVSYIQDTDTRLNFALNTNSDTLILKSSLNYHKNIIDKNLFENFIIELYEKENFKISIVKNKNKILNNQEKNFISLLASTLKDYDNK
ncbi:MAG: hypothetical protein U0457_02635 [Candidatus Sericytochromatia bacterium]